MWQSIQHVVRMSSAALTAAASTRRNGSATESLTVTIIPMRLPRTPSAPTLVEFTKTPPLSISNQDQIGAAGG